MKPSAEADAGLTDELYAFARNAGADLLGVADASDFAETQPAKRPTAHMKDARTVFVFACRIPFAAATPHVSLAYLQSGYYGLEAYINKISHRTSIWLEDRGYLACGSPAGRDITGLRVYEREPLPRIELLSSFDLRLAAVKAGIGQIGVNNNLITAQYGSRLRLGAVITNAPLVANKALEFGVVPEFCTACGFRCVKSCPAKALDGKGAVDHYRCMVIHPEKVDHPRALITLEKRYGGSPHQLASKMMGFTQNAPHTCARCISVCPMDSSREDRKAVLKAMAEEAK
jgi:epoxyqueuosine reductase QueG